MLVIKGIDPQLHIQGPTQQFIFNVNLAALQFNNTFVPTSMIPVQNNFETRNNTLSGFRWIHNTSSGDTFGSLTLQSFVYGQPTGTDIMIFNQDGSITFDAPVIVDIPPIIDVSGTSQTFSYSGAHPSAFILQNTFAATSGNPSFVDLDFINSTTGGFRFRHTSSTTDYLGTGNFELDYITNGGGITPLFTVGITSGVPSIVMNFTATEAIFSGSLGLGGVTPATYLQFPNTFSNGLLALHQTGSITNQFFGFGVTSGQLRYQIDATSSAHQWYAGTGSSTSTSLMSLTGTGTLTLYDAGGAANFTINSAQVNSSAIILNNTNASSTSYGISFTNGVTDNANLSYNATTQLVSLLSFGASAQCQVGTTNSNLLFNFSTSNSTFTGSVGIGTTPTSGGSHLQFNNITQNNVITLWEVNPNPHEFYGFGLNSGTLRYQIGNTTSTHAWYAGVNSTTSNQLMTLTGTGDLIIGGTLYGKGPYMSAYVSGSYTQTVTSGGFTLVSNFVQPTVVISNQFFLATVSPYQNGSYQYTSSQLSPIAVSVTVTASASFSGTSFNVFMGIYKNNAALTTAIPMKQFIANTNSYIFTLTTQVTMATNDYLNVTFKTDSGTTTMTLTAFNININSI